METRNRFVDNIQFLSVYLVVLSYRRSHELRFFRRTLHFGSRDGAIYPRNRSSFPGASAPLRTQSDIPAAITRGLDRSKIIISFLIRKACFSVDTANSIRYTYFCICDVRGSIAQLGEHLPYKQGVTGSSPVVPTIWMAR